MDREAIHAMNIRSHNVTVFDGSCAIVLGTVLANLFIPMICKNIPSFSFERSVYRACMDVA